MAETRFTSGPYWIRKTNGGELGSGLAALRVGAGLDPRSEQDHVGIFPGEAKALLDYIVGLEESQRATIEREQRFHDGYHEAAVQNEKREMELLARLRSPAPPKLSDTDMEALRTVGATALWISEEVDEDPEVLEKVRRGCELLRAMGVQYLVPDDPFTAPPTDSDTVREPDGWVQERSLKIWGQTESSVLYMYRSKLTADYLPVYIGSPPPVDEAEIRRRTIEEVRGVLREEIELDRTNSYPSSFTTAADRTLHRITTEATYA